MQYLGQKCVSNIQYLDQQRALLIQELLIKKSIAPGPNSKTWGKKKNFIQQDTM